MRAREERKIIITMSPKELRDMADEMEKRWKYLKPGQSTFVDFINYDENFLICLHLDQAYFHALEESK